MPCRVASPHPALVNRDRCVALLLLRGGFFFPSRAGVLCRSSFVVFERYFFPKSSWCIVQGQALFVLRGFFFLSRAGVLCRVIVIYKSHYPMLINLPSCDTKTLQPRQ